LLLLFYSSRLSPLHFLLGMQTGLWTAPVSLSVTVRHQRSRCRWPLGFGLQYCFGFQTGLLTGRDIRGLRKRLLRLWNSAPPTPIKDIADSSSAAAAAAVANIASLGYFRFLFPEFPVEGRFIVPLLTLTVNNMKCDVLFEFEIRFLDSEF
jgi:hypothetical protein